MKTALPAGAQAVTLFAAARWGEPWLRSAIVPLLPQHPVADLVLDAAMLAAAAAVAFLLTRPLFGARSRLRADGSARPALATASGALFVLGLLAVAIRIVDPAYDGLELGGRGLDSPAALVGFLTLLPPGVAVEEIVFRCCQSRLRVFLPPAPAAVAVAVGFAAYHWHPGWIWDRHGIETALALVAGGLVLAAAYEMTARLALLVAVHLAYDLLAVVQAWLNVRQAHAAEAALFVLWLSVSGALAWKIVPLFRDRVLRFSRGAANSTASLVR